MLAVPNRLQKVSGWSCSSRLWHPRRLGCDCVLNSCRPVVLNLRLPYLRRQNSWQFLWLLFTTTNKRYAANFSMFLQLPKQHYCHRRKISQNCCTSYKLKVQRRVWFLSQSWLFIFSEDLMIRSSETVKIPDIRAFIKIISGHKF